MPKISTPKPDYSEKQFAAALRRHGFVEQPKSVFSGRRFTVRVPHGEKIQRLENVPSIYEGYGVKAKINLRLTLKHLQSVAALAAMSAKKYAPEPTPLERAAAAATAAGHDPEFFPTPKSA